MRLWILQGGIRLTQVDEIIAELGDLDIVTGRSIYYKDYTGEEIIWFIDKVKEYHKIGLEIYSYDISTDQWPDYTIILISPIELDGFQRIRLQTIVERYTKMDHTVQLDDYLELFKMYVKKYVK
jgi:hypothetical protein